MRCQGLQCNQESVGLAPRGSPVGRVTFLMLIAGMLALLLVGRFSHPVAIWRATALTACVWLAIGWVAWIFPPYMS